VTQNKSSFPDEKDIFFNLPPADGATAIPAATPVAPAAVPSGETVSTALAPSTPATAPVPPVPERRSSEETAVKTVLRYDAIKIGLASPETIKAWSRGEVKKPETINYRTFKPEKNGLFCEKIFGPTKDWECACGKYKRIKYKDVVCDRCGVEVTQAKVRRERMGHIDLACLVSHIWYLKGVPSRLGYLLEMSTRNLERVIYYESYVVIEPGKAPVEPCQLLTEEEYLKYREEFGAAMKAKMGAEAIRDLIRQVDLVELDKKLRAQMKVTTSEQKKKTLVKRLKVLESFLKSDNKPEWMFLEVLPVIPPELRPLVPLDGGRFATSDLNDLYRRVINRNNRLKKLLELKAPEVIVRNEKRMLQEAVDALLDNGRRGHAVRGPGNRPLKSLSDMLKGKQGRFRQNLLGKRVDYSGRSVIVVGPELKMYQCGLPKIMALELFKPFIIKKLEDRGYVHTIKSARKMVERVKPEVWDILAEVIQDHCVLLNRAPTLHRQGIQAFQPVLIEGKAIQLHPLVCTAFNADFDGDQMAVHVPLSSEAQLESKLLMLSTNNINSTANGRPIVTPTQDIVLGCYYLTKERPGAKGEGRTFSNPGEVQVALDAGEVVRQTKITVRIDGKRVVTTVGRVLFNRILPKGLEYVNRLLTKKELGDLVALSFEKLGTDTTVKFLDDMKELGYENATRGGITVSVDDMKVPPSKPEILKRSYKEVADIESQYRKGIITAGERYNKVIDIWTHTTDQIADVMFSSLQQDRQGFNPIYIMADSGARGSKMQIRQLAGMRGLMAKPIQKITGSIGEIIESPITANFREGLTALEYFISTHGARKGLADTALKTADAGYLTRRLVDVAQEVIINIEDCGTNNGIRVGSIKDGLEVIEPMRDRIIGRVALDNVADLLSAEVIVKAGQVITEKIATKLEEAGIEQIRIRSVLTCELERGVCAKCYGVSLANNKMVQQGEAVGIIAAQSIGEPGTQLTLRTFHVGGTASRALEQSKAEARKPGEVRFHNLRVVENRNKELVVLNRNGEISVYDEKGRAVEHYIIPFGALLKVREGEHVKEGYLMASWDLYKVPIFTEVTGTVKMMDLVKGVTMKEEIDEATGLKESRIIEYKDDNFSPRLSVVNPATGELVKSYHLPTGALLTAEDGQKVEAGDVLARLPRESSKTRDITGGLPRVAELVEARRPKSAAIVAKTSGMVQFMGASKGVQKILIVSEEGKKRVEQEYAIPFGKHLNVHDGDNVRAGDSMTDGAIDPHDILEVQGEYAVQEYLLSKVQEVYRLQGVKINDKHIEVIVRQMMRKVVIQEAGDTEFLSKQQVDKIRFQKENARVAEKGGKTATARTILLGITKASLGTESFLSAASFQETTKVLTEAAVSGKTDHLLGLKENIIMGHMIPAGTGSPSYKGLNIIVDEPVEELPVGVTAPPSLLDEVEFAGEEGFESQKNA
jgi:DNA-directed RNA polymerase subunit beta'